MAKIPLKLRVAKVVLAPFVLKFSPARGPTELLSNYRFRYAKYLCFYSFAFAVTLGTWFSARPNLNDAPFAFVVMFLYIGLSLALATCIFALCGFLIGGTWALDLKHTPTFRPTWEKLKLILVSVLLTPVSVFALYWFVRGLLKMETLLIQRRGRLQLITPADNAEIFWLNLMGWGSGGFALLWTIIWLVRKAYVPNLPVNPDTAQMPRRLH